MVDGRPPPNDLLTLNVVVGGLWEKDGHMFIKTVLAEPVGHEVQAARFQLRSVAGGEGSRGLLSINRWNDFGVGLND